jgi:mannose-6-phosphate isomerase-like protein (cupin superfamily)
MEMQEKLKDIEQKQRLGTVRLLAAPETGCNTGTVLEAHYEACGHCPPHYHDCDEVLVFLEGEGTLFVGQEPRPVFAGTTVSIPAGTPHCFYNTGIGHVRLLAFLSKGDPEFTFVNGLFTSGPPVIATEEMFAGML